MLSPRLSAIAALIEKGDVVADIGSDHGLLVAYLARNGYTSLYANENKKGPYNRLKKALSEFDTKTIEIDLADGLSNLPPRINTVVIAGMGGELVARILREGAHKLSNVNKLILAPHNSTSSVRKMLNSLRYTITYEEIVSEKDTFYEVIVARKVEPFVAELNPTFGTYHLKIKSLNFTLMLEKEYTQNEMILQNDKLPEARRNELEKAQELIKEVISKGEKV